MLRHLRTALTLLVLAAASAGAQTIPPPALAPAPGPYASAVDSARLLILERMDEVGIPGFSEAVGAGGGFLSTSPDLVRYGQAYLNGSFLAQETVDLLWTSQETTDGEPTGYGIGWNVREREGEPLIYHTGGATGGSTILMILPDDGVVVSILTNLQSVRHVDTAWAIARLFAGVGG